MPTARRHTAKASCATAVSFTRLRDDRRPAASLPEPPLAVPRSPALMVLPARGVALAHRRPN